MFEYERVYAEIDLDAVKDNVRAMKKHISDKTKIMAVIKTDGYGHGAIPIARTQYPAADGTRCVG